MTMSQPGSGDGRAVTRRPVLGSYDNYEDARTAVDKLSDAGFPVQNVAIVGVGLRLVESVLGRRSWGRAALGGMATGAWFGLLVGLFVGLFAEGDGTFGQLMLIGILYGAAFGIVFGLISFALTRGRHDFLSRQSLVADRYDVHCEAAVIGQARLLLRGESAGTAWPPPLPPDWDGGPGEGDQRPSQPPASPVANDNPPPEEPTTPAPGPSRYGDESAWGPDPGGAAPTGSGPEGPPRQ